MNAWHCVCGSHGIVDSQRSSARALEDHLASTGHRSGEYFYGGCVQQRTTVVIDLDDDGRCTRRLAASGDE
ncbi:MAG: hypothetical protein M3Z25_06875 [Actinomycetota bacterium]|nr:hypothetical protein [Actinomycetota bacterium]